MTPDSRSELLACVAAFGRSLDESFDPARFLAEFSVRTQRLVPHDDMLILLREEDGQTYSLFAEYAVRGSLSDDNRRYTTAFERGGRAAAESFALTPVFGGEAQLIADMATDDRFGEAAACWKSLREAGLRARLAVPLLAGGRVGGALVVMSFRGCVRGVNSESSCGDPHPRRTGKLTVPITTTYKPSRIRARRGYSWSSQGLQSEH